MNVIKKISIALAFVLSTAASAFGQHYIGVRGGYGVGMGRFYPPQEEKMVWGMYTGGIAWKYYSHEKYLGGIGAEIEYVRKAYEYNLSKSGVVTDSTYRRTINTVQVPLIWQPHANMMNNRLRVFLNAGIAFQYNFPVSQVDSLLRGEVYYREKYESKLIRDNPFGYGLIGGLGFNVIMSRWEFTVEARYYFGFGDILRNTDKYPGNPRRSPMDNITLSTGFFYRLTDGLHNPPQTKRQRKREERKAEEQMMDALLQRQQQMEEEKERANTLKRQLDPEDFIEEGAPPERSAAPAAEEKAERRAGKTIKGEEKAERQQIRATEPEKN